MLPKFVMTDLTRKLTVTVRKDFDKTGPLVRVTGDRDWYVRDSFYAVVRGLTDIGFTKLEVK